MNTQGLQVKSFWDAAKRVATCSWTPNPEHQSGPDMVNGGILFAVMDCHSIATAIAAAYQDEDRKIGSEPHIWYVTKCAEITYRKPTPLAVFYLSASVQDTAARRSLIASTLESGGIERASMTLEAVRVPPHVREP